MNQNLLQLYRELMKIVIKIFRFTYIPTREPPNAPQKPNRLLQCLHPHKSSLYSINGRKVENIYIFTSRSLYIGDAAIFQFFISGYRYQNILELLEMNEDLTLRYIYFSKYMYLIYVYFINTWLYK